MSKVLVKQYAHIPREDNWEVIKALGIDVDSDVGDMACRLGYEEELWYEIDLKTGSAKLVGANGFLLSDKKIGQK